MRSVVLGAFVVSALAACSGDDGSGGGSGGAGATAGSSGAGATAGSGGSGATAGSGGSGATGGSGGSGATGGAGAGGSGGVGPGPERTIEEYCQMDADVSKPWCDYAAQCCSQADQDDLGFAMPACTFGPDDPADCVTFVNDRIADGTMAFDGTWADACVAKQAANIPAPPASCDGLPGKDMILDHHGTPSFHQIPECRKLWVGLVQQGGACDYEAQCAEGLACADDGTGTYVCQPVGTAGTACILDRRCDDGLICNAKLHQCGSLGGVGAACLYSSECQNGLLCASSKCATPIPLGGSCAGVLGGCTPGTGCSFSTSTCVSLQPDGASCSFSGECLGRCDTTLGKCVSICGGDSY